MPFLPAEHHGKLVVMAMLVLRRRGRGRRARPRARSAALAEPDRRHGPADALPGDLPAGRGRATTRSRRRARMFVDAVDRGAAQTIVEHLQASNAPMRGRPAARARRGHGPRAGRRHRLRPPPAPHHGQRRRASTSDPDDEPVHAGLGRAASRRAEPGRRTAPTSNFLGDEGEARVRAGLPGPDLGPAGGDQGALRPGPTCSGSTRTSHRRIAAIRSTPPRGRRAREPRACHGGTAPTASLSVRSPSSASPGRRAGGGDRDGPAVIGAVVRPLRPHTEGIMDGGL